MLPLPQVGEYIEVHVPGVMSISGEVTEVAEGHVCIHSVIPVLAADALRPNELLATYRVRWDAVAVVATAASAKMGPPRRVLHAVPAVLEKRPKGSPAYTGPPYEPLKPR